MNLLSNLWKPAIDIKPDELIGKQLRNKYGTPCLLSVREGGLYVCFRDSEYVKASLDGIQYLDESPEAIREMLNKELELTEENIDRTSSLTTKEIDKRVKSLILPASMNYGGYASGFRAGAYWARRYLRGESAFDYYAKAKNMFIWIWPESECKMNGKVTYAYEIEILPYTEIGQYFTNNEENTGYKDSATKQNHKYSYYSFDTYDQAKAAAIERCEKMWNQWVNK